MQDHIEKIRAWLEPSIGTGEIIKIAYMGGSKPGTIREIVPLAFSDDGISLYAVEPTSGKRRIRKEYRLEKIAMPEDLSPEQIAKAAIASLEFHSLEDLLKTFKDKAEAANYAIVSTEDSLGIFERFKNGNPKKSSLLAIYYEEMAFGFLNDELEPVYKKSEKPWRVGGKNLIPRAFKDFKKAAHFFATQCMNELFN